MDMEVKIGKLNLSLLAQVLAQNAGVEVVAGPHLATNGKQIFIPPGLIGDESAATIIRGGITHEAVGHCRHTDFSIAPSGGLEKSVLNVLEDIRIEKASWLCYPGAKRILEDMAVEVDGLGWFDGPQQNSSPEGLMLMALLRDMRARILLQPIDGAKTSDLLARAQKVFGNRWAQIVALAEQGAMADSTADVLTATKKIVDLLCKPGQPQPQPQQQSPQPQQSSNSSENEDQEEDGQQGNADESDDDQKSDSDGPSKDDPEQSDGESDGEPADGEPAEEGPSQDGTQAGGDEESGGQKEEGVSSEADGNADAEDAAGSQSSDSTDADGAEDCDEESSQGGVGSGSGDEPTSVVCDANVEIDASLDSALGRFLKSDAVQTVWSLNSNVDKGLMELGPRTLFGKDPSASLAMRLRNELERLLFTHMQDEDDAIVDRGRLDSTRLVEAMTGSRDVFTREQEEGESLDTEVYILADRSGSTYPFINNINHAVRGMGAGMAFLEGSHLDFGVWYFDDYLYQAKRPGVRWRKEMDRCSAQASGGTDWLSTFSYLMPKLAKSKRTRKVLYTITDGDLGTEGDAQAAIRTAKMSGIDLVFLMVNAEEPGWFRKHQNISAASVKVCDDGIGGLHRAIFKSLQRALLPS